MAAAAWGEKFPEKELTMSTSYAGRGKLLLAITTFLLWTSPLRGRRFFPSTPALRMFSRTCGGGSVLSFKLVW
jgi:hypothetical protein